MQIRTLQAQLDRHKTLIDESRAVHENASEASKKYVEQTPQDISVTLEDIRRREINFRKELQAFLQEYKRQRKSPT